MGSYDERIFHAIARLIHERDPVLDEDEIKRQALDLIGEHARAEVADSISSKHPALRKKELEYLQKQAEGLADALENLSLSSKIVLGLVSDPEQLPDLQCLQLEAKKLGVSLQEGLKKKPAPSIGRKKLFARESLIEEATNVFEKAYGVNLSNWPKPRSQQSRDIKHKYFKFVRAYMPDQNLYERKEQFETLKKAARRYIFSRQNK